MAALSDYLENILINATLRGIAYISPSAVYVALFTANPSDADSGTEVNTSGTAYTRMAGIFSAPSNGATSNSALILFPTATAAWGTITHVGIYDASTGGNLLYHGALSAPKTISGATDVFRFETGSLIVTIT